MKTALAQYIIDLNNGTCKGEEYYLELEKRQAIYLAEKCQLIRDIDLDENVKFVFDPLTLFNETYTNDK